MYRAPALREMRHAFNALSRFMGMASIVFATAIGATEYPRAELATDVQHVATWTNAVFDDRLATTLTYALSGDAGRQMLLRILANFSAAIDAPALAYQQWSEAAALAHRRGDFTAETTIVMALARSAIVLGEYDEAMVLAERATALAQRAGDVSTEAAAQNVRGIVERRRGHLDIALAHQERARALFEADSNGPGAMRALSDLGTIWRDRGDFARALEAQLDAVAGSDDSGARLDLIYRNIGILYREIEDAPAARDYFQRALELASRHGVPSVYATIVGSYAGLFNDLGEFAHARDAAAEALAIDIARGDRPHQGLEHLELGRALRGLGDEGAATAHFQQALQLGRDLGQREIIAPALLNLGKGAQQRNERDHARELVDEAITGLEAARLRPQLAQAYALREQLALAEHDDATALKFAHKHAAAREDLIGTRASRQLAALEARHVRALAQERVALLKAGNELKVAHLEAQVVKWRLGLATLAGLLIALVAVAFRYRIARRLNHALDQRNNEIDLQRTELADANAQLRLQAIKLNHAAMTDSLTGILNRRGLLQQLERWIEESAPGRELGLMLIDFDHFKLINDRRGHLVGDRALIAGAAIMRACLRDEDLLGRLGGEEFVVVIRDQPTAQVLVVAERLRREIADGLLAFGAHPGTRTTVSIGVAFLSSEGAPARVDRLLEVADDRLYEAKRSGRNRIVHEDPDLAVVAHASADS